MANSNILSNAPITKRSREEHLSDLCKSLYELEQNRDNIFTCGLEPGQVGFLCGPGGQGKTFLTLQLAMSLASGLPLLGPSLAPTAPGRVVYVALEETAEEMSRREAAIRDVYTTLGFIFPVEKISSNLDIYNISDSGDSVGLFNPDGSINTDMISILEDAVTENADHAPARLLILDPLNWLIGLDETKNEVASRFMPLLISYAKRWNCAILIIGHITKSTSRDAKNGTGEPMAEDLRGAGAFSTGARWVSNLVPVCIPQSRRNKKDEDDNENKDILALHCHDVKDRWTKIRILREQLLTWLNRVDLIHTDPICREFPYHPANTDAIMLHRLKLVGTKRNSGGSALAAEFFTRVQCGVLVPDAWREGYGNIPRIKKAQDARLYLPPLSYSNQEEVRQDER